MDPIGIFDSGIGGLTIAERIIKDFPNEEIIYFGDTAHLPYGDKSEELIRAYSHRICEFLIEKNCKLIIIACNSASSAAYDHLRENFTETAFLNVVDPAVKAIAADKKIKDLGIIGTQRTINSRIYEEHLKNARPDIQVHALATPLLAPMIEAGFFNNQISEAVIEAYLSDEKIQNIDSLILACTHYPLIKKQIKNYYKDLVSVYDSTDFISAEVGTVLDNLGMRNKNRTRKNRFFVSDLTESFEQTTRLFFKDEIDLEFCPLWDVQQTPFV